MKTIKIEFNEQSRGVTAHAKVEVTDDDINVEQLKKETKELYEWAFAQSRRWTLGK